MNIRWYRIGVFVFWLAAMSWLVTRKILPALLLGEPPDYATVAGDRPRPAIAWKLAVDGRADRPLGWALSEMTRQSTDATEIKSLVGFNGARLIQFLPLAIRSLVEAGSKDASASHMEVESAMLINPLGQLQNFHCRLKLDPRSPQSLINIDGNVDADKLKLSFHFGESQNENLELRMPDSKIRDSFSPETELRGLRKIGQNWTIISYSPFVMSSNPFDLLQKKTPTELLFARVEDRVLIPYNGESVYTWVVVYRSDERHEPGYEQNIRNRLWVKEDGSVLKQEVVFGGHGLTFTRMGEREADELRAKHKDFLDQQFSAQP